MKINRFDQFVKNRINEDVEAIETPEEFENEEGIERTEEMEEEDDSNLIDEVDQDLNDDIEDNEFDEEPEDDFGSEETMGQRPRTVKSYNDFEGDDEFNDEEDEFPGGEWSEDTENREPDEDYMFHEGGVEEEEEEGEEESGEYKGEVEMKRLADMLGTEVVNNQIEFEGKKINYYSETEKFHVGKKKFETPEEVIDYLESGSEGTPMMGEETPMPHEEEEEMGSGHEEEMRHEEEEMPNDMAMESRRFIRRRFK